MISSSSCVYHAATLEDLLCCLQSNQVAYNQQKRYELKDENNLFLSGTKSSKMVESLNEHQEKISCMIDETKGIDSVSGSLQSFQQRQIVFWE